MQALRRGLLLALVFGGVVASPALLAAKIDVAAKVDAAARANVAAPAIDAKDTRIISGAESFGPFYATEIQVDLRELPAPKQWKPGDPVKVVPKQYRAKPQVDHGPDYQGQGPDALAQIQRDYTTSHLPIGDTRTLSDPIVNVAGPGFNGVWPPDTTGEVGKDYYIQMINGGTDVTILNKSDGSQAAHFNLQTLAPPGHECATGLGDPVILYDELAERWLLTEFSDSGNWLCMYVSKTTDPIAGGYWFYAVQGMQFPDYPKYGIWPDAYYIGTNESQNGMYALDRAAMLTGAPMTYQRFQQPGLPGFGFGVMQPVDLDGTTPPPVGTPGYFMRHHDDEWHDNANTADDYVELWEFHVDWGTPGDSFVQLDTVGGLSDFDSELCDALIFACFTQPSGPPLDPLREVVMQRVAYRNFGTYESMVANFVTDLDGTNHGGIRWIELRRPDDSTPWSLYQEGTWTLPLPDFDHRWMGSIAQDVQGNIALAYSVSSSITFPSMRYTGRMATDPTGVMTQGETEIVAGLGSSLLNRWGDYAAMSVDPVDGCTFWHTNMFGAAESWGTQIASFRFDGCTLDVNPDFTLNANHLDQAVCSPGDLDTITVDVGALEGFSDPVTLSYDNMPSGFSGVFSTNPVTPGNTSNADVNVTAGAGNYMFDIVGSAAGVADKSVTVNVAVADSVAGSTTLTSPADGSPSEPAQPTLMWTAASGATSYLVEIDDDPGFGSVDYSATSTSTSHTVGSPLAPGTWYWRVTPASPCGDGATSSAFSFTISSSLCGGGTAIPEEGSIYDEIVVGDVGTITDLNVYVDISHSWVGDLTISALHVDTGTSVTLIDAPLDGSCPGADIDATLDDEAIAPVTGQCVAVGTAISGDFQPEVGNFLSDFDGESISGTWRLQVTDGASPDGGNVNNWCLEPTVDVPPPPDTDDDGVPDAEDNCVDIPNAGQEDSDVDENGDPAPDGIGDACDNCTLVPNADQCDTNGDGYGNVCDADINNNGVINFVDLNMLKAAFGTSPGDGNWNADADLTCNDTVNFPDLAIMKKMFYGPPGPSGLVP